MRETRFDFCLGFATGAVVLVELDGPQHFVRRQSGSRPKGAHETWPRKNGRLLIRYPSYAWSRSMSGMSFTIGRTVGNRNQCR